MIIRYVLALTVFFGIALAQDSQHDSAPPQSTRSETVEDLRREAGLSAAPTLSSVSLSASAMAALKEIPRPPARQDEIRIALIIGNVRYQQKGWELKNPGNDARLIASRLRQLGFERRNTEILIDGSRQEMYEAISRYRQRLQAAGPRAVSVFFFAGHGIQDDGQNYLLPVDSEIRSEVDAQQWGAPLSLVFRHIANTGNAVNLVFIDACRDNPLQKETRTSGARGLAREGEEQANLLVGYATSPGFTARDDRSKSNSPYTTAVAAALAYDADQPVFIALRRAHRRVYDSTNGQQAPDMVDRLLAAPDWSFRDPVGRNAEPANVQADPIRTLANYLAGIDWNAEPEFGAVLASVLEIYGLEPLQALAAGGDPNAQYLMANYALLSRHGIKDDAQAAGWFSRACRNGHARACANLGYFYANGRGVTRSDTEAVRLYQMACEGDDAVGCTNLGFMYEKALGIGNDNSQAARFYRKGCEGGSAAGCRNLAYLFEHGKGVGQDIGEAVRLYRQGCDGGEASACTNLGLLVEKGMGIERDMEEAARLYRQGCDGGSFASCGNLAYMYESGNGVDRDYDKSFALYRRGCDGGNARSCSNLGYLYRTGRGVRQSDTEAVRLYRQACEGGNPRGCSNLGYMYEKGLGIGKDDAQAARYYRQGCDGDDVAGCHNLSILVRAGRGTRKNESEGQRLRKRACDLGGTYSYCKG
jgi:TPR repeat protein